MDIKHLAKLSRIDLTAEEEKTYSKQLEDILNYFELLKEADDFSVCADEGSFTEEKIQMREDSQDSLRRQFDEDILWEDIPEKEGRFVRVKKVM
ncbi:MAG: Asp-tRNA(Asn)/Glu-tRNA(Gln) amidotransferase subunit GatC [bacterium]